MRSRVRALTVVFAATVTGCASMPSAEVAWHTLNAVDAAQTINIARAPSCYHERSFPTRQIIGRHPDVGEVALIMAGYSVAYHFASRWVADKPRPVQFLFHGVAIATKLRTIERNHGLGLRPFGSGCDN